MVDGPPNALLDTSARFTMLGRYQAAWERLELRRQEVLTMHNGLSWELAGGILAQTVDEAGRSLVFTRLPSQLRGIEAATWTHDNLSFAVRDFSLDSSQDLLVIVSTST